ncbi:MAG: hemerythrin domain-containing protein [Acidobacteria bacterium]|nr:hemerythrin domain-containing protein [Acidobacteriota bacterium]
MELIDTLQREHILIENVVGSLRTWASAAAAGSAPVTDGKRFMTFFRVYAGSFHHEREESVLFPALVRDAGLPAERGPIAVILDDHRRMAAILDDIETILARNASGEGDVALLAELAKRYSHELWGHIDAENSVLLPESEERLRQNGIRELPCREPDERERDAMRGGQDLVAAYPPMEPDSVRGDGCMMCPAYGPRCGGVEREWWNENEWDEFADHIGAS